MGKHEFSRPSGEAQAKKGRSFFNGTMLLTTGLSVMAIGTVGFVAAGGDASAAPLSTSGTPTLTATASCDSGITVHVSGYNPALTHDLTAYIKGGNQGHVSFSSSYDVVINWPSSQPQGDNWEVDTTNPALQLKGSDCNTPMQTVTGQPWGSTSSTSTSPTSTKSTSPTTSPSSSSSSTTTPVGTKTIWAKSLDQSCPSGSAIVDYVFVITSKGGEPPASIQVTLANGQTYTVLRDGLPAATAHYTLTVAGGGKVVSASADVPANWDGQFNLSHLDCSVSSPPPSSSTTTPPPSSTSTPPPPSSSTTSPPPSSSTTSPPPSSTTTSPPPSSTTPPPSSSTTPPPPSQSSTTTTSPTGKPKPTKPAPKPKPSKTTKPAPKPSSTAVSTASSTSKYTPGAGGTGSDISSDGGTSPAEIFFASMIAGGFGTVVRGAFKKLRERRVRAGK